MRQGKISAVIPAAGFSARMHEYKPLLKLGRLSILEHTIESLKKSDISDILVVTGHKREKIESLIRKSGAVPLFNRNFRDGMLSSIKKGVKEISSECLGFLLLPADIPLIRNTTIEALISTAEKTPKNIIIPYFNRVSGHPPFIPAWMIPEIFKLKNDSNLGSLLLSLKNHRKKLMVHDRGVLLDADTKEAYELLKDKYESIDIPDREECDSILMANLGKEQNIQSHVKLVAKTALMLAKAVQGKTSQTEPVKNPDSRIDLDMDMIYAGALLHDIKRTKQNHAHAGYHYLISLGFPEVADIAGQHMDLTQPVSTPLTEVQIVYFADKLCNGDTLEPNLNYSRRFHEKIIQTPHVKDIILKRYGHTKLIHSTIEKTAGKTIKTILSTII